MSAPTRERLRIVVLMTDDRWSASVLALGTAAHALSVRGHVVGVGRVAGGAVARAVKQRWPHLSVRDVRADGWWRRASTVRDMVQALRPDVILVGSDDDAAAAALAMGSRGGVVQRVRMPHDRSPDTDADAPGVSRAPGWRHRTALSRSRVLRWGPAVDTVILPPVTVDAAESIEPERHPRLPLAVPHVVLVVSTVHDQDTAAALRTLGALHERHPELRVTLVADSAEVLVAPSLQDTRVHAAAVGLARALDVLSLDQWMDGVAGAATACWIVSGGDVGAVAALAAMHRGVPVIVEAESALATLVVPLATGLHASAVLSDLARLIGDNAWHTAISQAAQLRARRHFAPEVAVDNLEARLVQVAAPVSRSSATASA